MGLLTKALPRASVATGSNAQLTPTIAAAADHTNYLTGFSVTGLGATAASGVLVTITGLLGGTRRYRVQVPAGATTGITPLVVEFTQPQPASAKNTAIVLTVAAFGAGNTEANAELHGFAAPV